MTTLATLAQTLNVEALSVGLELSQISGGNLDLWQNLISNIRKEYSGLLTYCSIFWPIETQNVVFWQYLDFISMDTYLPFWNGTGSSPSLQDMENTYSVYLQGVSAWKNSQANISSMPLILSEVGYPSRNDGLISPSSLPPSSCPKSGLQSSNLTAQDAAWTAVLSVTTSQTGRSCISGISVFWYDNPSSQDYLSSSSNDNDTWACDWTPRGKPAECTIAKYFNGTASVQNCGASNNSTGNGNSTSNGNGNSTGNSTGNGNGNSTGSGNGNGNGNSTGSGNGNNSGNGNGTGSKKCCCCKKNKKYI